jgi:hypothetical protein
VHALEAFKWASEETRGVKVDRQESKELTLAGEAEGALEGLQARDRLLGVALAEAVVGEEAGIVLDRAVQLVTAHCVRETEEEVASV